MTVSLGPYQRPIPFVNIQDIRLDENDQGQYLITIGVSNEKVIPKRTRPRTYTFGNFIYFSSSRQEIDALSTSQESLIQAIKDNPQSRFKLKPNPSEFVLKSKSEKSNDVYSYLNRQRVMIPKSQQVHVLVCSYVENKNNFTIGNVIKETLLSNNVSTIDATVFVLDETVENYGSQGTVWPGSVHVINDQFMAGNTHIAAEHPNLSPQTVLNVRLKDLRVIKAANSLNYEFVKDEKPYFSPVTLSRGASGNVNGSFTFDLLSFSKNNCKFGPLIKNDSTLLASANIKDIIIFQKVSGRDYSGNALTPGKSQKCGLAEANSFKRVASLNNNCSIVSNTTDNVSMVDVFFVDDTTREVNSGAAEYMVEIVLEDNTEKLLKDLIFPIKSELRKVNNVKEIQDSLRVFNTITVDYLTAVQAIFGSEPFAVFSQRFWRKNLLALVNKFNPQYDQDKNLFITTMNNFVSKIERMLQAYKTKSDSFDVNSMIYISRRNGNLSARRNFKDKYIFTGTRDYGLDILDSDIAISNASVPNISFDNYTARATKEVEKFQIINTNAASLNPFGYLTAQSVNLTPNPLRIDTSRLNADTTEALPIIQSKTQKISVLDVNKKQSTNSRKSNVLNALNISVVRNPVPLRETTRGTRRMAVDIVDSAKLLSETSDFVYETKPSDLASGSNLSTVESVAKSNVLQSLLVNTVIDKSVTEFNTVTKITQVAELSGSPAQQKLNEDGEVISAGSAFSNAVDFNSVTQVQYLDSYDIKQGVSKQNWKLLTPQKVESSKQASKPLICKLVKVSSALGTPDILDLEPMTSMFVIGNAQTTKTNKTTRQVITSVRQEVEKQSSNIDLDNVEVLYAKNIPFISLNVAAANNAELAPATQNNPIQRLLRTRTSALGY